MTNQKHISNNIQFTIMCQNIAKLFYCFSS